MTDTVLASRPLYKGWLSLIMLRLRLGGIECERAIVDHVSGTTVLAYDPDRRVAMTVRQTRDAVLYLGQASFTEAIAGATESEAPADTAYREAFEETGLRLHHLEPVAQVWMTPSSTTERVHLFLAEYRLEDRIGTGGGMVDELETIDAREEALATLWADATSGRMADAKLFMLLQALRLRRPDLF
ncbi:NUDIX hydrolase [Sphingomonas sp. RP10(2022)]|uniref:NUDIX hydrolase n=1 Tax=Sphingomonas liriopis TaxID=2949094 RepID=A0A9X2HXN7_9SPHN|nr:NUDIX hydrolase [Sphingomonas liriopis]MCP3736161.1 NUDIX hydrolase [Sphingomonas liriopis]